MSGLWGKELNLKGPHLSTILKNILYLILKNFLKLRVPSWKLPYSKSTIRLRIKLRTVRLIFQLYRLLCMDKPDNLTLFVPSLDISCL